MSQQGTNGALVALGSALILGHKKLLSTFRLTGYPSRCQPVNITGKYHLVAVQVGSCVVTWSCVRCCVPVPNWLQETSIAVREGLSHVRHRDT